MDIAFPFSIFPQVDPHPLVVECGISVFRFFFFIRVAICSDLCDLLSASCESESCVFDSPVQKNVCETSWNSSGNWTTPRY